jgi:hypothetical protein
MRCRIYVHVAHGFTSALESRASNAAEVPMTPRSVFLYALCACSSPSGPSGPCPTDSILVVVSDYSSSGVGSFTLDGNSQVFFGSELGGDPALASSKGRSFFVARDDETLFELDSCGRGIRSFSAREGGDPPNVDPQDVAVLPDGSLLVPRFRAPTALVIDPSGSPRATVDLSAYDSDGIPDMSAATTLSVGGVTKAYIVLERLNPYPVANQSALLVVLDPESLAIEGTIDLGVKNPFGLMTPQDDSTIWLAAAGNFASASEPDAGVVRFDATTGTASLVVPETKLGGSAVEVAIDGTCGAVIVADATPMLNRTSVVLFDTNTGEISSTALGPTAGFDLMALAWAQGALVVGDRRGPSGFPVHVMQRSGSCEVTPSEDILLRLPPIAFGHN